VESTTLREKPPVSFQEAFDAQFLLDVPIPAPAPQPIPGLPDLPPLPEQPPAETAPPTDPEPEERSPIPSSPAQVPFWGPLLVAGTIAMATVVVGKGLRKR